MSYTWRVVTAVALVAIVAGSSGGMLGAQPTSPAGRWRTYDDRTRDLKSIVVISEADGQLEGRVERVFAPPSPSEHPLCDKCEGELKNQPVVGMRIMWGMKKDGDEYGGGRLLDPEEGKTYRGKVKLIEGGAKLQVRGFIGVSLFGRTQTWVREP